MNIRFQTFKEFYPYYLKEHNNKTCRLLHVIGTTIVFALAITAIYHNIPKLSQQHMLPTILVLTTVILLSSTQDGYYCCLFPSWQS